MLPGFRVPRHLLVFLSCSLALGEVSPNSGRKEGLGKEAAFTERAHVHLHIWPVVSCPPVGGVCDVAQHDLGLPGQSSLG